MSMDASKWDAWKKPYAPHAPATKTEYVQSFPNTRAAAEYALKHAPEAFLNKKTGEPIKIESMMRRFQSRGGKSQGEQRAVYKELGKDLPPVSKPIPDKLTVTVKGEQGQRAREFTVTFTGADAYRFVRNPSYDKFFRELDSIRPGYYSTYHDHFNHDDSGGLLVTEIS